MSYGLIKEDTLTDIANAIRDKANTSSVYYPSEMADAISDISTGRTSLPEISDGVMFIDYDGIILYTYTWDEVAELTELPDLPELTINDYGITIPMDNEGWQYTLEQLQEIGSGLIKVGCTYTPSDGKTHMVCYFGEQADAILYLETSVESSAVIIDWGDGTTTETTGTSATEYTHEYGNASSGYYDITITANNGVAYFYGKSSRNAIGYYTSTSVSEYYENAWRSGVLRGLYISAESITDIGSYAFRNCFSLANVTMPKGLLSIGSYAFYYCYSLAGVVIPENITSINSDTFYACYSLTNIVLSENITSIGSYAFGYCGSITSVVIPESVTSIGTYAFSFCYSLTNIIISASTISIAGYAFGTSGVVRLDGLYTDSVSTVFYRCYRLIYLTNVKYIGYSINLSYSPLDYDSVINCFNVLDESVEGTITLSETSYGLLSDDDIAIATDKGWTVAYS